MRVTSRDVLHIAALAGLRHCGGDVERLSAEISSVLEHVGVLKEVDVDGLDGLELPPGDASPVEGSPVPPADRLLRPASSLAPAWREGFFLVPPLPGLHPSPERDQG